MIDLARPRRHTNLSVAQLWSMGVAIAATALVSGSVYMFSVPGEAEGRLTAMEAQLKSLEAASKIPGDVQAFPAGSVCGGKLFSGYKDQLALALGGSGLDVGVLEIAQPEATQTRISLQVYAISIKASGPYESMVNGLNALSRFRPTLFLDTVSVRNKTDAVEIDLKGRVFCR
ncbi:hypothetical protein [Asticcacaulis sp.]|uniref:hypothetical protein n=1 Tax=Asticcacaulis sp. TaxID=1872648 RepID=UPI00391C684F